MKKVVILALDNLRSVENTASIFRTAEGLGVTKIILVGTTPTPIDRFGRKRADFAKVSLGAEVLEWEYVKEILPALEELKNQNFMILALEQAPRAIDLTQPSPRRKEREKFVLVVGNEVGGVSKEILDVSDEILEIPMQGQKESLNVSVATGIALFELLK